MLSTTPQQLPPPLTYSSAPREGQRVVLWRMSGFCESLVCYLPIEHSVTQHNIMRGEATFFFVRISYVESCGVRRVRRMLRKNHRSEGGGGAGGVGGGAGGVVNNKLIDALRHL